MGGLQAADQVLDEALWERWTIQDFLGKDHPQEVARTGVDPAAHHSRTRLLKRGCALTIAPSQRLYNRCSEATAAAITPHPFRNFPGLRPIRLQMTATMSSTLTPAAMNTRTGAKPSGDRSFLCIRPLAAFKITSSRSASDIWSYVANTSSSGMSSNTSDSRLSRLSFHWDPTKKSSPALCSSCEG